MTKFILSLCGYLTIPLGLILMSYAWIVVIVLAVLAVVSKRKAHPHSSYLAIAFTCCEILIVFYITVSAAHPHSGYYPALSDGHHHLQSSDLPSWEQVGSLSTEEAALIRKLTHLTYKGAC